MNELDRLMSEDPLNLSSQDIDAIIEYQRQMRTAGKPKKDRGPAMDTSNILEALKASAAPQVEIKRRKL